MPELTGDEILALQSKTQRFRLYLAVWDAWQVQQTTVPLTDATDNSNVQLGIFGDADFDPVVNIGSNRLAFIGEAIDFDASRSFRIHNDSVALGTPSWSFSGASTTSATGFGPHTIMWSTPGLYDVTCTIDGRTATRKVRVLQDRLSNQWDVTSVGSISASIGQGWRAQLSCVPSDDTAGTPSQSIDLVDFQSVGLFVEEEWQLDDGSWTQQQVSGYAPEPKLVLSGYVQQGTISRDANNHTYSFTLGSIVDQLNMGFIHGTDSWGYNYVHTNQTASPAKIGPTVPGAIFTTSGGLKMPDVFVWWLQQKTNVFDRHDFITWYDASQQNMDNVTTNDANIWSAFSSLADNEFAWFFADQGSGLHFEPNPHIRSRTWWDIHYPNRTIFEEVDLLDVNVDEIKQRHVIWVQLIGTRILTGAQWTSRYPSDTPPSGSGSWYQKNDLNVSGQSFLDAIVQNVYLDQNRKINVTLKCARNRAFQVPDAFALTLDLPARGISWVGKTFCVTSVSHEIDVPSNRWLTTISGAEFMS